MLAETMDLKSFIRDVPDFPKKGIVFKDITPLLSHNDAFRTVIERLTDSVRGEKIDKVAAIESRGFIFGGAVAQALGVGFIPVRKKGKLPYATHAVTYQLEYGTDCLEMHIDAVSPGERVLVVDDVLATGGTARAVAELVQRAGAETAGMSFIIELAFLGGRAKLAKWPVTALIQY
jgi:adenine phosphoribosyltransferase